MPEERLLVMRRLCAKRYSSLYSIQRTRNPRRIDYSEKMGFLYYVHRFQLPFIRELSSYLDGRLAVRTSVHGVLVDVYGLGVLIQGDSGIGKSETALELIKRGHRLIATIVSMFISKMN